MTGSGTELTPIPRPGELTEAQQKLLTVFPGLDPNTDVLRLMADNLGDLEDEGLGFSDLERITVPPGGGSLWLIPDLEDGERAVKTLEVVVLQWDKSRAMWISDDITGSMPDCWSRDGRSPDPQGLFGAEGERADELPLTVKRDGSGQMERLCANCPMNEFGSSTKPGAKGKQCKESRLFYVLQPGEALPQIVSFPPTSLKGVRQFLIRMAVKTQLRYTDAVLKFELKVVEGGPGGKYSIIVPSLARRLSDEERVLVRAASENLRKMLAEDPPPIVTEMKRAAAADGDADLADYDMA